MLHAPLSDTFDLDSRQQYYFVDTSFTNLTSKDNIFVPVINVWLG